MKITPPLKAKPLSACLPGELVLWRHSSDWILSISSILSASGGPRLMIPLHDPEPFLVRTMKDNSEICLSYGTDYQFHVPDPRACVPRTKDDFEKLGGLLIGDKSVVIRVAIKQPLLQYLYFDTATGRTHFPDEQLFVGVAALRWDIRLTVPDVSETIFEHGLAVA